MVSGSRWFFWREAGTGMAGTGMAGTGVALASPVGTCFSRDTRYWHKWYSKNFSWHCLLRYRSLATTLGNALAVDSLWLWTRSGSYGRHHILLPPNLVSVTAVR